jgi:tetratricopeptide (TPR) repeat protein/DNA-binding SARP family transcriptional activator
MAVAATRIRVLGPFELVHDGQVIPVDGQVGPAILTALASRADTKVLPAHLIGLVWGEPDAISVNTLYRHVTRLRRMLEPIGLAVVGHRPGYRLPIEAELVDVARFDQLLRGARALSATDPEQAADRLRAALALWRGAVAVDELTAPGIRRLAAGWQARRLDAEEDLAEIDLCRGRPEQVLDRLHTLVAAHPHRPRLAATLARALHTTGRVDQAHAVLARAEDAARRAGTAAHPGLAEARHELSGHGRPPTAPSTAAVVPFQLPADTAHFTGRAHHLAHLLDLPTDHSRDPNMTVVITAVEGMAGIGKTALAVHAAHQLAGRFGDGVLFTDLRGFTPDTEPTTPEHALDQLLRGLGVPGPRIPPDLDARVGLYRSVLAGRRVLIVLDNAAHETQLQPLLPSTPGCAAIVTSRRHLAGLDDATHLTVPLLDPSDAAELFRRLAGDRASTADRPVIERIVTLCGRLPLAIRITAARLRLATATSPASLCAELENAVRTGHGLDWLSDGHRAVTTALAVSFRHLDPDQQRAFLFSGLHPGTDVEPYALAALADTSLENARDLLDRLHAASLLDQPGHRRYTMHDLVAAYARRLATEVPEPDRHEALNRLYGHYAAASTRAMDLAYPWVVEEHPRPPASHTPAPTLADQQQAQAWLDAETDNLLATAGAGHQIDHILHQSATLRRHLRIRGEYNRAALLHQRALDGARRTGNPHAAQDALTGLGHIHYMRDRYEAAVECFGQALDSARQTGNQPAAQNALDGLGRVHFMQARCESAVECFEQALDSARQTGNHIAAQQALCGLGDVHYIQGRYEPAADCYQQALTSARRTGDRTAEHNATLGLGQVHMLRGEYGPAAECFERGLASARRTGNRSVERNALRAFAVVQMLRGECESAAESFEQALASARRTGDRVSEQHSLRGLGYLHHLRGRNGPAAECFEQVLVIARECTDLNAQFEAHQGLGRTRHDRRDALRHQETALRLAVDLDQPADQARAHDGLAHTHLTLGDPDRARHHWRTALSLLTDLGTDRTEEPGVTTAAIRAHLNDLDSRTP